MKQILWFVCAVTVSLTSTAKEQRIIEHADASDNDGQHVFAITPDIPDFPTDVSHRVPIYDSLTGELVDYFPWRIAKIAYIIQNVPREYRDDVFRQHGITVTTEHDNS